MEDILGKRVVSGRLLEGRVAVISGAARERGIGKATARLFVEHGARVALFDLDEDEARRAAADVAGAHGHAIGLCCDVSSPQSCREAVARVLRWQPAGGRIDVLVNNAAEQHVKDSIHAISEEQLLRTFRTNVFAQFFMVKAALEHLGEGSAIVNTTSVTAYRGSSHLMDYAASKGAIVAFTRSLSANLVSKGIRVNAVAPGPIWTPLIPATFPEEHVAKFGSDVPMERAGEPSEVAPSFVFLASDDSSYMTGQVLHPNGGEIIGG